MMTERQGRHVTGGGGTKIYVEETGPRESQSVLFIHGISQCRLSWEAQFTSDLAGDYRLAAMDLRGHGLSERPYAAYADGALWADDVQAVIEDLELVKPVVVAWSYGGLVISDYLRHYGPDRLAGVVMVGAATRTGTPSSLHDVGPRFLEVAPGLCSDAVETCVASLEMLAHLTTHRPLPPEVYYASLGYSVIVPPHARYAMLTRVVDNDDLLRTLDLPVLMVHGQDDQIILPHASEHRATLMPRARTSWYPATGHAPFYEDAPRFNGELRSFLNTVLDAAETVATRRTA